MILLALGAGAAITGALLNLQMDAKKRLTTEFRALGANVIIVPLPRRIGASALNAAETDARQTMDEALLAQLPAEYEGKAVPAVGFLYVIGEVAKAGDVALRAGGDCRDAKGQGLTEIRPGRRTGIPGESGKRSRSVRSRCESRGAVQGTRGRRVAVAEPGKNGVMQGVCGGCYGRRGRYAGVHWR